MTGKQRGSGGQQVTVEESLKDASQKMKGAISVLRDEFGAIRTGRATPAILSRLTVDYYGSQVPLNQLASFSVPEPRMLIVTPFDKNAIAGIEKAIMASDLGLTPVNDGKMIRLTMPTLTEERRKQLAKSVHKIAEDARVAVRNVRREANDKLKAMAKDKKVSEDEERRGHDQIQKTTDKYIAKVDELLKKKEQEILSI
jgi:ribosome recycling factor